MHRVYDPSIQMYRNMNAREAEAEADRLLRENERFQAVINRLAALTPLRAYRHDITGRWVLSIEDDLWSEIQDLARSSE